MPIPPEPVVVGVQVGQPQQYQFGNRSVQSAIGKTPVLGSVKIGPLGIEGDTQVDVRYHGGPERALCLYCADNLVRWEQELFRLFPPGSFGENLTVLGLTEDLVNIGDRFRFGQALVEISQPREPCGNLAGKLEQPDIVARIALNSRTGWYCRVVEAGEASVGLTFRREWVHPDGVSVAEAFQTRLDRSASADRIRRILAVQALSSGWRQMLEKRLRRAMLP